MFCEKCGTKLPDTAEFCPNCGTKIAKKGNNAVSERVKDTEIQLRVKPTFKFIYMLLPYLIIFIIMIFMFSLIFTMISVSVGIKLFLICFVIMAVILAIKTAINKMQYNCYCYDFYNTKVIYRDSFLNLSEKEVKYKNIKEVTMRQTFIQRIFNIGNIVLFTNAETGLGNGIFMVNIENVEDVYRKVKEIINV